MTEIKPKIIDGEPHCDSENCAVDGFSDNGTPETAWCQCCDDADPCIPGLRQQRDELKEENAELKLRWKKVSSITITNEVRNAINAIEHFRKGGTVPIGGEQFPNEECCYEIVRLLTRLDILLAGGE